MAQDTSPEPDTKGPSPRYWISQLDAYKESAKTWWSHTKEAWEEFLGGKGTNNSEANKEAETRYPIYWSSAKTVQPMLYSKTPITESEKAFDMMPDNIARSATIKLERLSKYLIRATAFDRAQYSTRDMYIHSGRTTNRVMFEAYISSKPKRDYYTQIQVPDPNQPPPAPQDPNQPPAPQAPPAMNQVWINAEGEQLEQGASLQQDQQGFYTESDEQEEKLEEVCIELVPLHYKDYAHNANARIQDEVWWMAFKSTLEKEEIAEKFGKQTAEALKYTATDAKDKLQDNQKTLPVLTEDVWEIWNKRKKEVYWLAENSKQFITPSDYQGGDPYELDNFFPCPAFMLGTVGPDSMLPTPDYIQLRPIIQQLHGMARRLRTLVRAARRRGVYDAGVEELKTLENDTDEAEFIGIQNFAALVGEGGLEAVIKYFPTAEIVSATQEMANIIELYETKFNDLYGIPDILKGTSDPNETAAAQQMKGKYLSLRSSTASREFQRLVRDDIELMCDLALKKFPEDKLKDIMGFQFDPPEEQQLWPQVLLLLQDDDERKVRIDIQTDSTITMNQNEDIEQRNYLAQTCYQGMAAVAQASQDNPAFAKPAMDLMMYVIRGLRDGKQIEGTLQEAIEQAMNPQPDNTPDYEGMKIQIEQQKVQADAQDKQQKNQLDQQRVGIESQKAQSDTQDKMTTAQLKAKEIELQSQKLAMEGQLSLMKQQMQDQATKFDQAMSVITQKLEAHKTLIDERSMYLDHASKQAEQTHKLIESKQPLPPITMHVNPQKPMHRIAHISRDASGNAVVQMQDLPIEVKPPGETPTGPSVRVPSP